MTAPAAGKIPTARAPPRADGGMARYRCNSCGYIYDPAFGEPARQTAPGTPFEELPDDWCCPDCRAPLADFTPLED